VGFRWAELASVYAACSIEAILSSGEQPGAKARPQPRGRGRAEEVADLTAAGPDAGSASGDAELSERRRGDSRAAVPLVPRRCSRSPKHVSLPRGGRADAPTLSDPPVPKQRAAHLRNPLVYPAPVAARRSTVSVRAAQASHVSRLKKLLRQASPISRRA